MGQDGRGDLRILRNAEGGISISERGWAGQYSIVGRVIVRGRYKYRWMEVKSSVHTQLLLQVDSIEVMASNMLDNISRLV